MKIKNGAIINQVLPALETLGKRDANTPLLCSLKIRGMLRPLRERAKDLQELRNEVLEQWGKKDGDGKLIIIRNQATFPTDEDERAFIAAMDEVYEGEWDYAGEVLIRKDLGATTRVGGAILADLGDLFGVDGEGVKA